MYTDYTNNMRQGKQNNDKNDILRNFYFNVPGANVYEKLYNQAKILRDR